MDKTSIICIDDERVVLTSLKSQISRYFEEKYNVEIVESAEEALIIIEDLLKENEKIPLIICDQIMPGMKGDEFLIEVHKKYPKILKILLTGQADVRAVGNAVNYARLYRYITKPWEEHDLLLTVKEAIHSFFQDKELEDRNNELEELNKTLEEKILRRTLEVVEKTKIIEQKSEQINGSIRYAQTIQQAILPPIKILEKIFPQHFVIWHPLDIVSGDFYFWQCISGTFVIAAVDCTGHGVPGAFMSVLGITLLNEIVLRREITAADDVLNVLRNEIKYALGQSGKIEESTDGMDIALCAIDLETLEMTYAGAFNPVWFFRDNEFFKITGDRQPVGIYALESPFTEHKFQLQTGDVLYIFSDGYYSQFGGPKPETFRLRRFNEILSEIHHLPLEVQKEILEQKFNEWKGNNQQTDDVLVIGLRI